MRKALLRPMDVWRCAIVRQNSEEILQRGIDQNAVVWLPDMPALAFRADPFGLWRDGKLYVFAEAFDYRSRIGHVDVLIYNENLELLEVRSVLKTPWHLSYPFVFEADGETWMLPEAYKSGTLTLYRARRFPDLWEPACDIPLDGGAIDATPLFYDGKWWLFYSPSADKAARRSHLHIAWSERLTGPWALHPLNPVRVDLASARPGGAPILRDGIIILPVQDCRQTYGGAIRLLAITTLSETRFTASDDLGLTAPPWMTPFAEGFHTFAPAGPVTLIDVKRMTSSLYGNAIRIRGIIRRTLRESGILP